MVGGIGATGAALPRAGGQWTAPAVGSPLPAAATAPAARLDAGRVVESRVAGTYFTGDPLTDRVVGEFARNPLGYGSIERAADAVSAGFTYDPTLGSAQRPVPGASVPISAEHSLSRFSADEVRAMSTADVIARSQSTLADAMRQGSVGGMMAALGAGTGPGVGVAVKLEQMQRRQAELTAQARAAAGTPDELGLLAEASAVALQVLLLMREDEKIQALKRLIFALLCGVVPKALIARMVELGMGPIVERVIDELVRSGRGISKEMSAQLHALAELGLDIGVLPEHLTVDAEADEDLRLAAQAVVAQDGRLVDAWGRTVGTGGNDAAAAVGLIGSTVAGRGGSQPAA